MKRAVAISTLVVALYLGLCAGAGILVADGALHPGRRELDEQERGEARQIAFAAGARLQDVALTSADGIVLKAWLIQPSKYNGNGVLLLHGLGDNRGGTIGYAEVLLAAGYSVLMPDARAHGESGGALTTYGLIERGDIHQWTSWLESRLHPNCILGLGESLGAAEVLQSLAAEGRFCAVVAESSFSNFHEIAYDRMGQQFGVGAWLGETVLRPVVWSALFWAEHKYGFRMEKVSPEDALSGSQTPVLLIHGADDHNIPPRHSERILRSRPQGTEIWRVPGVDHCGTIGAAPEEFRQRLLGFYAAHTAGGLRASAPAG
jgi:fermentation-respiration switch protein FrsA (DUF1100 family)